MPDKFHFLGEEENQPLKGEDGFHWQRRHMGVPLVESKLIEIERRAISFLVLKRGCFNK